MTTFTMIMLIAVCAGLSLTALAAIIRNTVEGFAPQMDDFRLAYLLSQVSGQSGLQLSPE